jgi:hypothetical protein
MNERDKTLLNKVNPFIEYLSSEQVISMNLKNEEREKVSELQMGEWFSKKPYLS